ncbi:MAG: site-specific integrase [Chloroflexota bacterium]|nr:site-specific integrase [Chloroflexota bacterium]
MRRPDFPLDEAINWFLADKAQDVVDTTIRTYRCWLRRFSEQLPESERILASLNVERAEAFARQARKPNTRMNMTIALKSFAHYLADKHLWFAGTPDAPISVLDALKQLQPTAFGLPAYTDAEVRAILRAVDCEPHRLRNLAVAAVLLHGFRAKEVRTMPRRCVIMPTYRERGHFIIADESQTKRGTHGVREVPMDSQTTEVLREYLRLGERPDYEGSGEEPLFLTLQGRPFTTNGWNAMAQRLRRRVRAETGIDFKQHRFRSNADATPARSWLAGLGNHRGPRLERRLGLSDAAPVPGTDSYLAAQAVPGDARTVLRQGSPTMRRSFKSLRHDHGLQANPSYLGTYAL